MNKQVLFSKNNSYIPKVSIIVPTYNVEKYASFCFDSLIMQSLNEIEIILVDDGSTDNSGKICDEYAFKDPRIKVIHQNNKGLGLSRNSGLEKATGEYVGFVDSDDCVAFDMFEVLYKNAKKYEADVSYCIYKKFIKNIDIINTENRENKIKVWEGEETIRQYLLYRIGMPPESEKDNLYGASVCCGIFSRKILDDVRFVSERQFIAEDMIFDIDIIPKCNKIVHIDSPLYYYRYNPSSLTTTYKGDRFEKNLMLYREMYQRLKRIYKEEECFNSMSRYLLTASRVAIIQEAHFVEKNGKKKTLENIKSICQNEELRNILNKYQYKKLPKKYAVFCLLEKWKAARVLLFLVKIIDKYKRKYR